MKLVAIIDFLRNRLKTVIRVSAAVLILIIILDALPFVVDKEHAHTAAEKLPAFWSGFGFVGCVILILVSKWFGKLGIMQREDYYDE